MARPCRFDVVQAHSPHTYLGRNGSMANGSDFIEGSWASNDCTRPFRRCSSPAKLGRGVCILDVVDRIACPAVGMWKSASDHCHPGVGHFLKCPEIKCYEADKGNTVDGRGHHGIRHVAKGHCRKRLATISRRVMYRLCLTHIRQMYSQYWFNSSVSILQCDYRTTVGQSIT